MENPRIVFMGSPEFAVPSLSRLAQHYPLVGVVTQPDRPAGRGQTLTPPPVKALAQELGLPVIQPRRLREPQAVAQLQAWAADLIIVAAFGQILRPEVLSLPRWGCVNVHASLLPRWRGAAPIQAAVLHGDVCTGVTIMCMDSGIDTGALLSQRTTPIGADDTAASLGRRLAQIGADLLLDTLPAYLAGSVTPQPQDSALATLAPMLKKDDGCLDFARPAVELERQVRAFDPWPGTFMHWQGQVLKILRARLIQDAPPVVPGRALLYAGLPAVATSQGYLALEEVQPAGKKPMSGKAFLQGARGWGQNV